MINSNLEINLREPFEDRLLTDNQVGELAQVTVNTVRYWRQTGLLPFVRVGRHPRVWLSEFNRIFKKPVKITPSDTGAVEAKNVSTKR